MPSAVQPPLKPAAPVAVTAAPPAPPPFRPGCEFEEHADGTSTIVFTMTADATQKLKRQAGTMELKAFLWDKRGLKHFEHQPIV